MSALDRQNLSDLDLITELIEEIRASRSGQTDCPVAVVQPENFPDIDRNLVSRAQGILQARKRRQHFLDPVLLGEPHWDLLLDLFVNRARGRNVSVSSACIASGAPATTALRYLQILYDIGMVERVPDLYDGRRSFVQLTEEGAARLTAYLGEGASEGSTALPKGSASNARA